MKSENTIKIYFCTKCGWLARAAWMAQEIINTFSSDISSLNLVPSDSGRFEIWCNDKLIFSRLEEGGFLEIKSIKIRIRDLIDPDRALRHNDPGKRK